MDMRRFFGNQGEKLAKKFLDKKGLQIIESQFTTPFGEIDLVAIDGDEVVFVEVKTRQTTSYGYPEEAITKTKIRHMIHSAQHYLSKKHWEEKSYRFDIVSILVLKEKTDIQYLKAVDISIDS